MFDIYTEILVIYLAFISSDPILQYIISMYNVKFTKFHETVGYVRGGSPKSGFDILKRDIIGNLLSGSVRATGALLRMVAK